MANEDFISKTLTNTVAAQPTLLKWSAALAGGTTSSSGSLSTGLKAIQASSERVQPREGRWITAACWHNCGGRCLNKAYVVDGTVLRMKTDDTHPDEPDFPQQRGCPRGRSQRMQVFGPDRLKYPMKRKNWAPGGGKRELRGKDEWVRISWDEALDIVASETKRIKETYGNKAILCKAASRALAAYGGYMTMWGTTSDGAWPRPNMHMQGGSGSTGASSNDRLDLRNSRLIVLWGANPAWSSGGNPTYNYLQAKKAGARIIMVDPLFSESTQVLADEWIPVRPGTDTALLLGIAYHMIVNGIQDQDFLDRYCVGFDAEHMPEGVAPRENFKDYVLGTYDGVPKTPEWASEICGTAPELIRSFALEIATTKPMSFIGGNAPARIYLGEQYAQAFLTVGWMTGNVGLSGAMVGDTRHRKASFGGPDLVTPGGGGVPPLPNPLYNEKTFPGPDPFKTDWHGIVWDEVWGAVLTGQYTATVRGKQPCDIRMISHIGQGAALNQATNLMKGIEAHRKVEFVVTSAHFLTTNAKYSDVVLPVTTEWERLGGFLVGNPEMLIFYSQVTEPLYEAKDDIWIERELGKRLGLDPEAIDPIPLKQQLFNQAAGARVIKEDGSGMEPLVTITYADIAEWGVDGEPQSGRITLSELKERGIYQVPRRPGDKLGFIAKADFRKDPEKNRLKTAGGKLEIHCQALSDTIKAYGFNTLPPIPKYMPPKEGYESTFADWENRVKGKYPLQLYTPHHRRRAHSCLDNVSWLREAFPQEFIINSLDAAERGIKQGDIVKIMSPHGTVIRPAFVTDRIVPGVTALGEGAWVELDDATGIDKAGSTNTLTGGNPTGQGTQPYNTVIVQVEKYDGQLLADRLWPKRIPLGKEG